MTGYDSHLFIKNLGKTPGEIKCIAKTEENYISFSKEIIVNSFPDKKTGKIVNVKRELRFIDSIKFMNESLASLANNLGKDDCHNLISFFEDEEKRGLLKRKGFFPYDWFSNIKKLKEEKFPEKKECYNMLNDENVSDEDYQHAQNVWKKFGINNMKEYLELYLKTDVLLLADVFENFRKLFKKGYGLDPAWYYTTPGMAWDGMLKLSQIELELLSDPNMYLMFEKEIRGGICVVSKRYSKANNPYMGKEYNPEEKSKYILYLDANGLYGTAMSNPLPVGGFEWMSEKDIENWENIPSALEVDLEYPEELHDFHNEYPLAPERLKVGEVEKLIPNLYNKEKYVIHYKNLKQCIDLGLKLKKIHKEIKFKEEAF